MAIQQFLAAFGQLPANFFDLTEAVRHQVIQSIIAILIGL